MHPCKTLRKLTPQRVLRLQCLLFPIPPYHLTSPHRRAKPGPLRAKLPVSLLSGVSWHWGGLPGLQPLPMELDLHFSHMCAPLL